MYPVAACFLAIAIVFFLLECGEVATAADNDDDDGHSQGTSCWRCVILITLALFMHDAMETLATVFCVTYVSSMYDTSDNTIAASANVIVLSSMTLGRIGFAILSKCVSIDLLLAIALVTLMATSTVACLYIGTAATIVFVYFGFIGTALGPILPIAYSVLNRVNDGRMSPAQTSFISCIKALGGLTVSSFIGYVGSKRIMVTLAGSSGICALFFLSWFVEKTCDLRRERVARMAIVDVAGHSLQQVLD